MPAGPEVGSSGVLERPRCPLCKNTRAKLVVQGADTWSPDRPREPGAPERYSVVRCEICAHRYTTPRFTFEARRRAFEGSYPFYARARGETAFDLEAARAPFLGRADGLSAVCPRPGRLLDVGCGDGLFLDVMRARGWQVRGFDVDPDVVAFATQQLDLAVAVADVEQDSLPPGPFDAITM